MFRPLIEWARERMATDPGAIRLPELTDEALDIFAADPKFLRTEVRNLIYQQLAYAFAVSRGVQRRIRPLELNGETTTIIRWREHTSRGHLLLTSMTRTDLSEAITLRNALIEGQKERINFLSALQAELSNDTITVGERFSNDQIENLRRRYISTTAEAA